MVLQNTVYNFVILLIACVGCNNTGESCIAHCLLKYCSIWYHISLKRGCSVQHILRIANMGALYKTSP